MEVKNEELWSLDCTIAKFVLPRLKKFKEISPSSPLDFSKEEWQDILDHMIYAMEYVSDDKKWYSPDIDHQKVDDGLDYFGRYLTLLWF